MPQKVFREVVIPSAHQPKSQSLMFRCRSSSKFSGCIKFAKILSNRDALYLENANIRLLSLSVRRKVQLLAKRRYASCFGNKKDFLVQRIRGSYKCCHPIKVYPRELSHEDAASMNEVLFIVRRALATLKKVLWPCRSLWRKSYYFYCVETTCDLVKSQIDHSKRTVAQLTTEHFEFFDRFEETL